MGRVRILDPTAAPPATDPDPGPDAGSLEGKRVGIRFDRAWRSWLFVIDEWETRLRGAGATVVRWEAGNRIGVDGQTRPWQPEPRTIEVLVNAMTEAGVPAAARNGLSDAGHSDWS